MKVFISGGCKNGKSYYAQQLAKHMGQADSLYYIATMASTGHEDDERIVTHQKEREGWGFETIEQPTNISEILTKCNPQGSFLLDSLTALLANEMFSHDGNVNHDAWAKIADELIQVTDKINNIVIVSDYLYSDAIIYDPLTNAYRKHLAGLDKLMAEKCDVVLEAVYTQIIVHKGRVDFALS